MTIQTVSVAAHPKKPEVAHAVRAVSAACAAHGLRLLPDLCRTREEYLRAAETADVLIVLGGDGTILHTVPHIVDTPLPILGINLGHVGFLTEAGPSGIHDAVEQLAKGRFELEHRMLLKSRLTDGAEEYALNDVVVSRGGYARLVTVRAYIDGMPAGQYVGDGMIVATPTGSTGYSLSAGGPIVAPTMACMVLAPICPHSLTARPMIMDSNSEVRLEMDCEEAGGGMQWTVDGRQPLPLAHHAQVTVRRAEKTLPFIRLAPHLFYERLRGKLAEWSR